MSSITCKNCDHHFKGNFCPHCGQSAKVEAIGVKYFLHDIPHSIFHIDKGFGYTFKELLLRPGKTLREYLAGKRVKHFRPFAYVVLMAALYILLSGLIRKATVFFGTQMGMAVTYGKLGFFWQYLSVFFFIMIPFASFATWFVLRKEKYNYWEHFLINTYLTAQMSLLLLLIEIYRSAKILILKEDGKAFSYVWFITGFLFYIVFVFKYMLNPKTHRLAYAAKFFLLAFSLALVYLTGMSLAGMMTPWWGNLFNAYSR